MAATLRYSKNERKYFGFRPEFHCLSLFSLLTEKAGYSLVERVDSIDL